MDEKFWIIGLYWSLLCCSQGDPTALLEWTMSLRNFCVKFSEMISLTSLRWSVRPPGLTSWSPSSHGKEQQRPTGPTPWTSRYPSPSLTITRSSEVTAWSMPYARASKSINRYSGDVPEPSMFRTSNNPACQSGYQIIGILLYLESWGIPPNMVKITLGVIHCACNWKVIVKVLGSGMMGVLHF